MIVTAGSRGIGAAIARLAGRRGYDVCVNYTKSKDQAEQVVRDIEASGQRALAVPGDIGNETELTSLYEVVDRELQKAIIFAMRSSLSCALTRTQRMCAARPVPDETNVRPLHTDSSK